MSEDYGRTLVRIKFGSHLYGTSTPASDLDFKSVYVPRARDLLLCRVRGSISTQRPKNLGEKNNAGDVDEEAYSLQRFLGLVAEGQTVATDVLFAPEWAWVGASDPLWSEILANRHRLLTRRARSFIGYCLQQSAKYGLKGGRVAAARAALTVLEDAVARYGTRTRLEAADVEVRTLVASTQHVALGEIEQPGGQQLMHLEVCGRKLPYSVALGECERVVRRIVDEYGHRARQAETNEGVDWKALSHAVRIAAQGVELLSTGHVTFPSPQAARVLDIKLGRVPYREVAAQIEQLLDDVRSAEARSSLPDEVDRAWIDDLVERAHRAEVLRSGCS